MGAAAAVLRGGASGVPVASLILAHRP
jgi:hypothetical protein